MKILTYDFCHVNEVLIGFLSKQSYVDPLSEGQAMFLIREWAQNKKMVYNFLK